jgi:hypothetical protein
MEICMNILASLVFASTFVMAAHPAVAQQTNREAAPGGAIQLDHSLVDDNSRPINGDTNDSASQPVDPAPDAPVSQDSEQKLPSNPLSSSTLCIADNQCKPTDESPNVPVR